MPPRRRTVFLCSRYVILYDERHFTIRINPKSTSRDWSGVPRLLCTKTRYVNIAAISHILFHMCRQIRFALRATTNRGTPDARLTPLETARRHIGLKIGGTILDISQSPVHADLRHVSPSRFDLRSRRLRRDTNAACAAHEHAPSGLHEYWATICYDCRHMNNGLCDSIRANSCRASGPRSCPAGMSSPSGRDECVASDETMSQDRTRRGRRRPPQAIRHAQPAFVVARHSPAPAGVGLPERGARTP